MAVHSTKLFAAEVPTSQGTLYTCPVGKRTIVKSVVAANNNSLANDVALYLYQGTTFRFFWALHLTASGTSGDHSVEGPWCVMNAGDVLKGAADHASAYLWVSGAELTL